MAFTCIPVSYTHLDVYKRQAGLSVPVGTKGTIYVNGNADIRDGSSALNGSIGYRYDF